MAYDGGMKLLVFGQPTSYVDQKAFARMIEKVELSGKVVEEVDSLSRDGIARMEAYDIVSTPALLVLNDDGAVISTWQHALPSYEEIGHAFGVFT